MKKYIYWGILLLAVLCVFLFRREIMGELGKFEFVQKFSSKIVGLQPANEEPDDVGTGHYAYETLTDEEKLVYNQIAECLLQFQKEVTISTREEHTADQAFRCLLSDHPEIFWTDSYEMTSYHVSGVDSEYSFQPVYDMDKEEAQKNQELVEEAVTQCLAGIPENADSYETVKYLYEYIVLNTTYNKEAENDQNLCSVLINKESVCAGYAKAFQFLLQRCGMESAIVLGHSFNEAHAWNLVKLDDEYYYFDVTWGDPQFGSASQAKSWYVDYGFFGLTTEDLLKNHVIENAFALPECVADDYNYFKREGLYLKHFDAGTTVSMIEKQFAQRQFAAIRCADDDVYEKLHQYMIENGHIWELVPDANITYSEDEQFRVLTIFKE